MATFVATHPEAFHMLSSGNISDNTVQYLQNANNFVNDKLTAAGQGFLAHIQQLQQQVYNSDLFRMVTAVSRKAANLWQSDTIRPLNTIGELQNAPNSMITWIMAAPAIREAYLRQELEGYGNRYVDFEPGLVRDLHSDYRRVMDGVVVETENGFKAEIYFEEDDVKRLSLADQNDIIQTWGIAEFLLEHGRDDPTSEWNASL